MKVQGDGVVESVVLGFWYSGEIGTVLLVVIGVITLNDSTGLGDTVGVCNDSKSTVSLGIFTDLKVSLGVGLLLDRLVCWMVSVPGVVIKRLREGCGLI